MGEMVIKEEDGATLLTRTLNGDEVYEEEKEMKNKKSQRKWKIGIKSDISEIPEPALVSAVRQSVSSCERRTAVGS